MGAQASTFGSTQTSLLARVKLNDRDAWFRFCELYTPLICFWCRGQLPAAEVDDVVQEIFARLVTSIHRFHNDAPNHRFRSWLWTVARNVMIDYRRADVRRAAADREAPLQRASARESMRHSANAPHNLDLPVDDEDVVPAEQVNGLFFRMLEQIRLNYDERTWRAFWRVVVDEQPTADIARELGMSQNYVRQIKARLLRRLREEFGELLD